MDRALLMVIYHHLFKCYGPQKWWPGETTDEIIIGAILTQNTNWTNVEKAIRNLRKAGALTLEAVADMAPSTLAILIRPSGYYNIKTARLLETARWFTRQRKAAGSPLLESFRTGALRRDLLAVRGIGPETADSILLYALDRPVFVVDAYTRRFLLRHRLIEEKAGYEDIRSMFEENLPRDAILYNEYHALIVRLGKTHCRPTAICRGCPLEAIPDIESRI